MTPLQLKFLQAAVSSADRQGVLRSLGILVLTALMAGMVWLGIQSRNQAQKPLACLLTAQSGQLSPKQIARQEKGGVLAGFYGT